MLAVSRMLVAAAQDRKGATAIEYGLIAAGVGVAIATVIFLVGGDLSDMFEAIRTFLTPPTP